MKTDKQPVKLEREKPVEYHEVDVEVIVKFGKKRHPLTTCAAKKLRDKLTETLR